MKNIFKKIYKGLYALTHFISLYKSNKKLNNDINMKEVLISNLYKEINLEKSNMSKLEKKLQNCKIIEEENKNLKKIREELNANIENLNKKSIDYIYPLYHLGDKYYNHDKTKKQVLIIGYYGATNYGDELMLKSILNNREKNAEYSIMFSLTYRYNFDQWDNVFKYYAPTSIDKLEEIVDLFDEFILGGGAHIDDLNIKNLDFIPYLGIQLSKLFIKKNKIVRWIGVSSDKELKDELFKNDIKEIVNNCTEFSVRDPYSLNVLNSISGININKIKLVNDLVLSIPNKKTIGVTLFNFKSNNEFNIKLIQNLVNLILENQNNFRLCFLCFYNQMNFDYNMYQEIINNVNFNGVEYFISPEYKNVYSMIPLIKGCDLFINMRYHASLLSLSYKKPTISICYDIHPHYYNKMKYINEHFDNTNLIYFSDSDCLKKFNNLFKNIIKMN